jgi:hypothetical protein
MKLSSIQFEIDQLQKEKLDANVGSIAVFVMALFVTALLPSLLIRYVYASQQLLEAPKVLEYIPLAAFVLGVVHFMSVSAANAIRSKKIMQLKEELLFLDDGCGCGGDCNCGSDNWSDLDDLDALVEEAISEAEKSNKTKKSAKKSSSKKSPSRKKTAKKTSKKK